MMLFSMLKVIAIFLYTLVFNTVKNNHTKRGSGNTILLDDIAIPFDPGALITLIDNYNACFIAKKM